jgi:hypothetical protein
MISQLSYLQSHYVAQLAQLEGLRDLRKIQVRLRNKTVVSQQVSPPPQALSSETKELLRSAAEYVSDAKLSQALLRLASNKK